jgi:hypothetical protein
VRKEKGREGNRVVEELFISSLIKRIGNFPQDISMELPLKDFLSGCLQA